MGNPISSSLIDLYARIGTASAPVLIDVRRTASFEADETLLGATGLAGTAAAIWCSPRGWPPAKQRVVFRPSGVAVFLMAGLWLGGTNMIGTDAVELFLIGLPALVLGTWIGLKLFGKLNDAAFRRVVLVLPLLTGLSLLALHR